MAYKFDIKNKHDLDTERRREILPPEQTLVSLNINQGDIMADIGCGIGYFSFPASKIVGHNGKVYAMDILSEMLYDVEKRIQEDNISNIETILTEENDLRLEDNKVTRAFLCNVIHEAHEKEKFLTETKRILCPKGEIAIVEWKKINSDFGPPIEHRIDRMELVKILDAIGFSNIATIDMGEDFYGIMAQK